jgi:hypothetical protein
VRLADGLTADWPTTSDSAPRSLVLLLFRGSVERQEDQESLSPDTFEVI